MTPTVKTCDAGSSAPEVPLDNLTFTESAAETNAAYWAFASHVVSPPSITGSPNLAPVTVIAEESVLVWAEVEAKSTVPVSHKILTEPCCVFVAI